MKVIFVVIMNLGLLTTSFTQVTELYQRKQLEILQSELNDSILIHHYLNEALTEQRQSSILQWEPYYLDSAYTSSPGYNTTKFIAAYNEIHKVSEFTSYFQYASAWEKNNRTTISYNSDGKMTRAFVELWNNQWQPDSEKNIHYNSDGMNNYTLWRLYKNGSWQNFLRSYYKYESANLLSSSYDEKWENNSWVPFLQIFYNYYPDGLVKSMLVQKYNITQFEDYLFYERKYENRKLVRIEMSEWSGVKWEKTNRVTIAYHSNPKAEVIIFQFRVYNKWVNIARTYYEYNSADYLTFAYNELWENNTWVPGMNSINVRNPDGMEVNYITQQWHAYYRDTVTSLDGTTESHHPSSIILNQNYPNPFNPSTIITFSLPERTDVSLRIFNVLGEQVAELIDGTVEAGSHEIRFDASNLPSGIYFYRLQYGSFSETKKMLLLR